MLVTSEGVNTPLPLVSMPDSTVMPPFGQADAGALLRVVNKTVFLVLAPLELVVVVVLAVVVVVALADDDPLLPPPQALASNATSVAASRFLPPIKT
jgi:hypothetical protein